MEIFQKLGNQINTKWHKLNYDINFFAGVAEEGLLESDLSKIQIQDISQWVVNSNSFKSQVNIDSSFGEPPLTVYANDKFYIEILFWLSGTTAIHQHGFRGLFYVLSGSSIHTEYEFTEEVRINQNLLFGKLNTKQIELLEAGQHRAIEGGKSFIHALFHLEYPSVSVVIRTYKDPENSIQMSYLKPGMAINSFYQDHRATRQIQILKMLKRTNNPQFGQMLQDFVEFSDLQSLLTVTVALAHDNMISEADESEVIKKAEKKYPEQLKFIAPIYPEIRRVLTIRNGRNTITNTDHRLFMALLMNATSGDQIIQIVAAKFPDENPEELILRWIKELNEQNKFNGKFDDFQLDLVSLMFKKLDFNKILAELKVSYDPQEIENSSEKISGIYQSILKLPFLNILFR